MVCDPAPTSSSSSISRAPFHLAPDNRIVVIRARAAQMFFGGATDLDLFITSKTLLSLFEDVEHGKTVSFPWERWGPQNTRILPSVSKQMWCYPAHGSRAVGVQGQNLVIHEFNPYVIRRISASNDDPEHVQVVSRPSTIRSSRMFPRTIMHHLPCVRFITPIPATSKKGIMISEDSVVLVDVSDICILSLSNGHTLLIRFLGRCKELPCLFNIVNDRCSLLL